VPAHEGAEHPWGEVAEERLARPVEPRRGPAITPRRRFAEGTDLDHARPRDDAADDLAEALVRFDVDDPESDQRLLRLGVGAVGHRDRTTARVPHGLRHRAVGQSSLEHQLARVGQILVDRDHVADHLPDPFGALHFAHGGGIAEHHDHVFHGSYLRSARPGGQRRKVEVGAAEPFSTVFTPRCRGSRSRGS
jgi:hypothetical protein